VFPATSIKREIADKQKMDETNNISGIYPLQKTGRASEDPNLPINDSRQL